MSVRVAETSTSKSNERVKPSQFSANNVAQNSFMKAFDERIWIVSVENITET